MSSPEHTLSPPLEDAPTAVTPSQMGRDKPKKRLHVKSELSVLDILNIFRRRWFLSRDHLLTNVILAQKAEDGNISGVEFSPQYHSHLVKCAVALVPHPVLMVKKAMYAYLLELLNGKGNLAFFNIQSGGRKTNRAQKEKKGLARKRSSASKRGREREAAKVAKLPTRKRQCLTCGCKFKSSKTAKKHKCPEAKVERVRREAASGQASQATSPAARLDMPTATHQAWTNPPARSNNDDIPAVTGDLQVPLPGTFLISHSETGALRRVNRKEWEENFLLTGPWRLGPGPIPPGLR
jgi:predicted Zn-ribbon and HTH transcriptional regulator